MASTVKFEYCSGRVNNTPISKCIYCTEKAPNKGFPLCSDCFNLRSQSERPCCACKKTMVSCVPHSKMKRVYCMPCTDAYKAKQQEKQVKIEIPETTPVEITPVEIIRDETFHETTYAQPEKQRLLQMFEGLSHLQIVNIVYDMLEQKEQFIQATLNENDLLKVQIENNTDFPTE